MKTRIENIWAEFNRELKHFVLSKVKDHDDTKDIMQDVFIKLHSKLQTLQKDEKLKPWLYQITRNTINDHFRMKRFEINAETINIPSENDIPKQNEQFINCMKPHINKLPLKYKEALTKTEFGNYSQLQLAKELNISYSTLKSRVQRAKILLKKYFEDCCDISSDKYGNIISYSNKHKCKLC